MPYILSCPIVQLGRRHPVIVAGTIGGDIVLWDLEPMVLQQQQTTYQKMPTRLLQPEQKSRIVKIVVVGAADDHDDDNQWLFPTFVAICATGLVHRVHCRTAATIRQAEFSLASAQCCSRNLDRMEAFCATTGETRTMIDHKKNARTLLCLCSGNKIRAYDLWSWRDGDTSGDQKQQDSLPQLEPIWTLTCEERIVHEVVGLGDALLVVLFVHGGVKVVNVRQVPHLATPQQLDPYMVLAAPGREVVVPTDSTQTRAQGPPHITGQRMDRQRTVLCWTNTLVVVLEVILSGDDSISWGVAMEQWDEIQLAHGCAGLGHVLDDDGGETLVACLTGGTTYLWKKATCHLEANGRSSAFHLPLRDLVDEQPGDDDGLPVEGFVCLTYNQNPVFVYQFPMNVIDIFGIAVNDNNLLKGLLASGVVDDVREFVLSQGDNPRGRLIGLYDEVRNFEDKEFTLDALAKMPQLRSFLHSLASE